VSGDVPDRYFLYVLCFVGSLVPAAFVGWVVAVAGALFDEAVSTPVFVQAVVAAGLVAGLTFFFLMKGYTEQGEQLLEKVCFVVCLSAIALVVLGKAAARSQSLGPFGAGGIWLLLMLTVGFVPFSRNWGTR
jgi:hypothetical protein